jgi:hypothetical protein
MELSMIKMGQLSTRDAQLLRTETRVDRATCHAWRCSMGCVWSMRKYAVTTHIGGCPQGGNLVRQMSMVHMKKKRVIIRHILGDKELGGIGWRDIESMLVA